MSSCDFLSLIGLTVSIVMTEEALELNLRHNQSNYLILQILIIHKNQVLIQPPNLDSILILEYVLYLHQLIVI